MPRFSIFRPTARITPRGIISKTFWRIGGIKPKREIFFGFNLFAKCTSFLSNFDSSTVEFLMFRIIRTQLKIFNSIIKGIFVDMMHLLFRRKISTNIFFHYKPMLHDIFLSTGRERMLRGINKFIFQFTPAHRSNIPTLKINRLLSFFELSSFRVSKIFHRFSIMGYTRECYNRGLVNQRENLIPLLIGARDCE